MIPQILITDDDTQMTDFLQKAVDVSKINIMREIRPEKDSITIDQVRNLRKELVIKHVVTQHIVLWNFDTATHEAQNALLKVLEEKNTNISFYIQVYRLESILPTIKSRCTVIDLRNSVLRKELSGEFENLFNKISQDKKSYTDFSSPLLQPADRNQAIELLQNAISIMRRDMLQKPQYIGLIKKTLLLINKLESNNLNHQLCIDQWIIWMKRS